MCLGIVRQDDPELTRSVTMKADFENTQASLPATGAVSDRGISVGGVRTRGGSLECIPASGVTCCREARDRDLRTLGKSGCSSRDHRQDRGIGCGCLFETPGRAFDGHESLAGTRGIARLSATDFYETFR